ncbi:MAG: Crp/Fnr family transcriptional regulator [Eubacteriales bacterium]|nr:Crp/Fnr family transcriptional regulator [Eubacteriales bacterium]
MNYQALSKTPLFLGCQVQEVKAFVDSSEASVRSFPKGHIICHSGEIITSLGLVLSGSVQMESIDLFGARSILGIAEEGDIFAESYACIPQQPLLVDVVAREAVTVLFIHVPGLFSRKKAVPDRSLLLNNLLGITAMKNVRLSMRIFHSSPKKIRDRLYSYFSEQAALQGSTHIRIALDRQQLADYLGVERTALSKELSKMQKEGLIQYHKNEFHLYVKS